MKVLHLHLKKKWYQMIEDGTKREEYREISPYWKSRFVDGFYPSGKPNCINLKFKKYDVVTFYYGYTKRKISFIIDYIAIGYGLPEWGAEPGKVYYCIRFNDRVNV